MKNEVTAASSPRTTSSYGKLRQTMSELSDVIELVPHRCVRSITREHSATYAEVQQMGTACRLCGVFVKILEAFAVGKFPALFQGVGEARRDEILENLSFWVNLEDIDGGDTVVVISFMGSVLELLITRGSESRAFAVEGVSFPYPDYFEKDSYGEEGCPIAPVPYKSNRHYSARSLERAKAWLHDCSNHHSCGKSRAGFYPKRLLDLGGDRVRLFETKSVKNFKGPYVCLSHRWGSSGNRLTSTVVNIHNHMNGIPWEGIPRTFQDAIAVCKHMSVSYLWIDTVCILQEYDGMSDEDAKITKTDFAAENSAMARIYQNSYLTICASISTNMDSGIFPTKYDHRIKVTADDGHEAGLRIRVVHSHETPPTDLETRGWTYQEYVLPPRILEFGPFDISWKCQEDHFCECVDEHFTMNWGWRGELAEETRPPENVPQDFEYWWIRTIRHYTGRSLTNQQDKLPALSGLAQMYHEVTDDTYLAGLWKSSLPYNLCWYHCSGEYYGLETAAIGIGRRPQPFRAPSWSWASLDALHNAQCRTWWPGTVDYNISIMYYDPDEEYDMRAVCGVHEVAVQPRTVDPFGELAPGGFLKLGVTLIPAKIDTNSQDDPFFTFPDIQYFRSSAAWTLNHIREDRTYLAFCFPDCELEEDGLELGDEVHCAPIVERLSQNYSVRGCLVLKRLQNCDYRRVGFCILVKNNPDYGSFARNDRWGPNSRDHAQKTQSYAVQYTRATETRITIV